MKLWIEYGKSQLPWKNIAVEIFLTASNELN